MRHFKFYIFLGLVLLCVTNATRAQAYEFPDYLSLWFPQWFGEVEEGPDPAKTLRAPFADSSKVPKNSGEAIGIPHRYSEYDDMSDLSKPHRNHTQIGEWLTRALAEVTTIDPDPTLLKVHFTRLETGMNDFAIDAFKKFLKDNAILSTLQERKMTLNSVINSQPLLLNEGIVEGRYRWLYQVPMTITFVPKGAGSQKNPDVIHQNMVLVIQVGRVTGGVQGKAIETWQVKSIEERIYSDNKK